MVVLGDGVSFFSFFGLFFLLIGQWCGRNVPDLTVVVTGLPVGKHILHCEVLSSAESKDPGGGTEFRIVSMDSA